MATIRPSFFTGRCGETEHSTATVPPLDAALGVLPVPVLVTTIAARIKKNAMTVLRKVVTPTLIVTLSLQLTLWG
ncbi:hypothetical protein [Dactylosporangium cerinum]